MSKPTGVRRVFLVPAILAVVSGGGLIAALLVEGPMDLVWTAAVAIPLAAIAVAIVRSRG